MKLIEFINEFEERFKQLFKLILGIIIITSFSFIFVTCKKDLPAQAIVWVLIDNTSISNACVQTLPPNGSSSEFNIEKYTDENGRVYFSYDIPSTQGDIALILPVKVTKKIGNITYQSTGHILFRNGEAHEEIIRLR